MRNMYARYIRRILKIKGNLCKILEIENIIYYNRYTKTDIDIKHQKMREVLL